MGLPRITYNGLNVDFDNDIDELDPQYPDLNIHNTAKSGMTETLVGRCDVLVRVGQSMEADPDFKRKMRNWHEWAKKGKPWTYARDRNEVCLVHLAAAAAEGDTTIELTDASLVVVGKQYVIRTETLLQVVKVDSVSAPNVTISEPLIFDFPINAVFRSELFWRGRLMGGTKPITDGRTLYSIGFDFKEDFSEESLVIPDPDTFGFTTVEEYEDLSDVNPTRSFIEDGAKAIGTDPDECATLYMHQPNSITPNYANLLISGAPEPTGPLVSATIRVTTEYVPGGSASAPNYECRVYNQRNKEMLPAGNVTGHISTIDSGAGTTPAAKAQHTVTYTALEFATYFPGGAADIWLRFGQFDTLSYTCSPDVEYRVFGRPTIEYVYA